MTAKPKAKKLAKFLLKHVYAEIPHPNVILADTWPAPKLFSRKKRKIGEYLISPRKNYDPRNLEALPRSVLFDDVSITKERVEINQDEARNVNLKLKAAVRSNIFAHVIASSTRQGYGLGAKFKLPMYQLAKVGFVQKNEKEVLVTPLILQDFHRIRGKRVYVPNSYQFMHWLGVAQAWRKFSSFVGILRSGHSALKGTVTNPSSVSWNDQTASAYLGYLQAEVLFYAGSMALKASQNVTIFDKCLDTTSYSLLWSRTNESQMFSFDNDFSHICINVPLLLEDALFEAKLKSCLQVSTSHEYRFNYDQQCAMFLISLLRCSKYSKTMRRA